MAEYHLYFLDGRGAIEARHDFRANEDAEAITLAGIVSEAVSDTHAGYELWNHAHCLVSTRDNIGSPYRHSDINALYTLRQRNILDVEETLLQSHWRVAQSQKLLEATRDLRGHWTAAHPYLEKTVRLACEIADAYAASLFLVAGSVLRPYIVYNLPQEYIAGIAEVRIGTQCCGRAVASKKPWIVTDMLQDPLFADGRDGAANSLIRAAFSVPVFDGDNVIASLACHYTAPHTPSALDIDRNVHFARLIGITLKGRGMHRGTTPDSQ